MSLVNRIAWLTVSKAFFQINKYTTTKLSIINGLANKLVTEIRACMVEDFSLKPRQTEVDRVS